MSAEIPGLGRPTTGKTAAERVPLAQRSTASLRAELRRFDPIENDYTAAVRAELAKREQVES